ncbi:hypothetical protein R3W88_008055 [Solanum pinnatisectum]|uniref:Uncharacterized protein n=1 Tax=Solanum pinnatisectum TaxID=50273 RepID=A0AAV9M7G9_9SOLN|nr:hypothetical protein R3W88_008055 [Solanum pinnatisectum]
MKTPAKEPRGISEEKQQGKEEKAIWRVKDKTNITENKMHQSNEEGETQTNINNMERTGKSVNFTSNNHDHNNLIRNNPHNGQNEHGKGSSVMQADVILIDDQNGKITHKDLNVESKIPPPIKVSSNFDNYRPNQQRNTQTTQNKDPNKPRNNLPLEMATIKYCTLPLSELQISY